MRRPVLAAWVSMALAVPAGAQEGLPLKPARTLEYDVSSGTFMSLALSPDGKTILFDMLGEIYALPATGGRAVPVSTGLAFEVQPVFSPDGQWIAYVSDRSGGDNVWIARADGSDARRISEDDDGAVRTSPEWSADGQSVYVSRYRIRLGHYELWRHPIGGRPGELVAAIRAGDDAPRDSWQSTLGVSPSRDGKYLYYARRVGDLSVDEPVQWTIVRRDLATGAEQPVVTSSGGREAGGETFFRPAISPDSRLLAYATRRLGATRLRVRDLATGLDRDLEPAPLDLTNGAAWMDLIPRYSFTPDGKAILIAHEGRIERRPLDGTAPTRINFTAKLKLAVGPSTRISFREETGPIRAKLPNGTSLSPDGERVAYAALGAVYVQPARAGHRCACRSCGDPPSLPSWSPDGSRIVYVTWSDAAGGAVWTVAADGSGAPVKVSDVAAFYSHPAYTPDGSAILAVRSPAAARQQTSFEFGTLRPSDLVSFPIAGGAPRVVTSGAAGAATPFRGGRSRHRLSARRQRTRRDRACERSAAAHRDGQGAGLLFYRTARLCRRPADQPRRQVDRRADQRTALSAAHAHRSEGRGRSDRAGQSGTQGHRHGCRLFRLARRWRPDVVGRQFPSDAARRGRADAEGPCRTDRRTAPRAAGGQLVAARRPRADHGGRRSDHRGCRHIGHRRPHRRDRPARQFRGAARNARARAGREDRGARLHRRSRPYRRGAPQYRRL
ncbi:hypothetical protein [Sphingopyxis sp. PET50]|uniref:hypothetical protein n=1 Tax=Sphingopyxis sp. PET50 TaxID=2976533 RepID=UPI0021AE6D19|nr:hypothetical protein [Sphingopyxis sp. PET50]